jgi:hypothetical protein
MVKISADGAEGRRGTVISVGTWEKARRMKKQVPSHIMLTMGESEIKLPGSKIGSCYSRQNVMSPI